MVWVLQLVLAKMKKMKRVKRVKRDCRGRRRPQPAPQL